MSFSRHLTGVYGAMPWRECFRICHDLLGHLPKCVCHNALACVFHDVLWPCTLECYAALPWSVCCSVMECFALPWFVCCSVMVCMLLCHGVCVALPWSVSGSAMECVLLYHGSMLLCHGVCPRLVSWSV